MAAQIGRMLGEERGKFGVQRECRDVTHRQTDAGFGNDRYFKYKMVAIVFICI